MDEESKKWLGEWLKAYGEQNNKQLELLEKIRKMISYFYWVAVIGVILALLSSFLTFCGSILGL